MVVRFLLVQIIYWFHNGVLQSWRFIQRIWFTITFSSALTSSDNINFIMALGNVLDVGTPTDGTVNVDKFRNAVTTAKIG